MKKVKRFLLGLLLTVLLSGSAFAARGDLISSGDLMYFDGEVVLAVKVNEDTALRALAEELAKKYGLEIDHVGLQGDSGAIYFSSEEKSTVELIQLLSSDPSVNSAGPKLIYPIVPTIPPSVPKNSSGGGCDAGYRGVFVFLLLNLLLAVRGKRVVDFFVRIILNNSKQDAR